MKLLKTLAIAAAFAAVAIPARADGLLGRNYVAAGIGTTMFDAEGLFDSREHSFDAAATVNYNVAPHADLNLGVDYSRVSGDIFGDRNRIRSTSAMLRGVLFGGTTPGIRPFVSGGIGLVDASVRFTGGSLSDSAFAYGVGAGVEFQMFPATALRLGTEWLDVGKLSDGGFEIPRNQNVRFSTLVSHHFTEELFGLVNVSFDNEWNDTSFLVGAGWHF